MTTTDLTTLKEKLIPSVNEIISKDISRDEKLFAICELLADEVVHFDWVGFYIADPSGAEVLTLGPFVGDATDHTRIPFGVGICGQVALSHKTFVSQNVHEEDNYLSCSANVHSEIVAPIMKDGAFVAQLDIDSHKKDSITTDKRELVEEICNLLSKEF